MNSGKGAPLPGRGLLGRRRLPARTIISPSPNSSTPCGQLAPSSQSEERGSPRPVCPHRASQARGGHRDTSQPRRGVNRRFSPPPPPPRGQSWRRKWDWEAKKCVFPYLRKWALGYQGPPFRIILRRGCPGDYFTLGYFGDDAEFGSRISGGIFGGFGDIWLATNMRLRVFLASEVPGLC